MKQFYEKWNSLSVKKTLVGKEALEAVKQNGYALRYVTEAIFTKNSVEVCANGKSVLISKESAEALGLL